MSKGIQKIVGELNYELCQIHLGVSEMIEKNPARPGLPRIKMRANSLRNIANQLDSFCDEQEQLLQEGK